MRQSKADASSMYQANAEDGQVEDPVSILVMGRKRSAGDAESLGDDVTRDDEDPAEVGSSVSIASDQSKRIKVSTEGSYVVYDLDGRTHTTRVKAGMDKIHSHSGLFRLLQPERLRLFLPELHFELCSWRNIVAMALESMADGVFPFESGSCNSSLCYAHTFSSVTVWKRDSLLEKFLKGKFIADDWDNLGLHHFLEEGGPVPVWGFENSQTGRNLLTNALANLQTMCGVLFDPVFMESLNPLIKFVRSDMRVQQYHNVFIRYYCERLISSFFIEVATSRTPFALPGFSMENPSACEALLRERQSRFITNFITKPVAPHDYFYSSSGPFAGVKLDAGSSHLLFGRSDNSTASNFNSYGINGDDSRGRPLADMFGSKVSGSKPKLSRTFDDGVFTNINKGAASGRRSVVKVKDAGRGAVHPSRICVFDVAYQLGGSKPNGSRIQCHLNSHISDDVHRPVNQVSYEELIRALNEVSSKWKKDTVDRLQALFADANRKGSFA